MSVPRDLQSPQSLREMCRKYDIRFKKGLGQNLLLDDNINRIMVDAAALSTEDEVIEVGAGLGALTRRLAALAGRVLAVEIDATFIPCLEEQFGGLEHVRLFRGDILNHSVAKLLDEFLPGWSEPKLVANLPYYITTPVLFHFLESGLYFPRMVVMVQEEVAERIVAQPGADNYGALSVAAQLHAEVDIVHKVPRTCFVPRPKVDSCIVRFRCHRMDEAAQAECRFVMRLARAAFSKRRKTLRNSLGKSPQFGVQEDIVLAGLEEAGVDPGLRPQKLSPEDFQRVARAIKARI